MDNIVTKFGEFKFNEKYHYYELVNGDYCIFLDCDKSGNTCENALETLKKYENNIIELDEKLRRYASSELLDLANDWLDDDDMGSITVDEFYECITMPSFTFNNDGSISVYYDDDDVFAGHTICVSTDSSGNPDCAEIAG